MIKSGIKSRPSHFPFGQASSPSGSSAVSHSISLKGEREEHSRQGRGLSKGLRFLVQEARRRPCDLKGGVMPETKLTTAEDTLPAGKC